MKKSAQIIFMILFCFNCMCQQFVNLKIVSNCKRINDQTFICELILSVPKGWKIPKAPDISIEKSENVRKIDYVPNIQQLNENDYKVKVGIIAENSGSMRSTESMKSTEKKLELSIDCPMCKDICTIVSEKVSIVLNQSKSSSDAPPLPVTTNISMNTTISMSIILILLFGFIGGMILNVMPCVLPVIVMKLRSLTSQEAIFGSIIGNYISFAAFATCIAFLKIAGEIVGWGMHFQNPYFLEITMLILFILTLYSFEIIQWFPSIKISGKHVFLGNCFSSIVASIVAIPCTAPFLGTAATFAIQGSLVDLYLVFFAIATGFSFPYFLSAAIPVKFFARFQPYGEIFKKIVSYGAFFAFLWMFYLLSNYLSPTVTKLYGLLLVALTVLLFRHYKKTAILLGTCCIPLLHLIYQDFFNEKVEQKVNQKGEPKNEQRVGQIGTNDADAVKDATEADESAAIIQLKDALARKQTVIFNITADWCLTCKYNHYRVFDNPEVIQAIKNNGVKFIEADMTKKNKALMKFINDHGRVGIPFTIIYSPRNPEGVLLDEILTTDAVISAII